MLTPSRIIKGWFSAFWFFAVIAGTVGGLQLGPLLSTCVDACQRGCKEIRAVQKARGNADLKVELKESKNLRSALTEADGAAQQAIVGGEEEEESFDNDMDFKPLRRDLFDDDLGETADVDISEVTVFVDPLDGTREFVEERLSNCQVLVGIAVGGEAVAGSIGIPFPAGDLSTESTTVYGLADIGAGVLGEPLTRGPFPLEHHIDGVEYPRPHIATGDSTAQVMIACREAAIKRFGGSNVIYGGAGNKILAAALGEVACSVQHKVGGPWDLCAPEAILKAMGGKITDLFGEKIEIYKHYGCNERGYLATPPGSEDLFHEALAAALIASPEVQKYRKSIEK